MCNSGLDKSIEEDAERFRFLVNTSASVNYKDLPGEGFIGCKVAVNCDSAYRKNLRDAVDVLSSNVRTKEVR